LALPGALTQIISGNGPILGLFVVAGAFTLFCAFLFNLRRKDLNVVQVALVPFFFGFISTGIALATEMLLIIVLFANRDIPLYTACGALVVFFRIAHFVPACYMQYTLSGHTKHSPHYLALLDDAHYLQHMAPYSVICVLAISETSFYRFLPWKHTEFAFAAGGYPDFFLNRLCTYVKAVQASITVIVQFVFVLTVNSHVENVSVSTQTVFVAGLCSTMLGLLLSIHEAATKANLLRQTIARLDQEEAQRASVKISSIELEALPSEKLAQMVRIEREAAAKAAVAAAAEKERLSLRLASLEATNRSSTIWKWKFGGRAGRGAGGEGGGGVGEGEGKEEGKAAQDGHFEQVNPMMRQFFVHAGAAKGDTTNVSSPIGRPPPPLPLGRKSFATNRPVLPKEEGGYDQDGHFEQDNPMMRRLSLHAGTATGDTTNVSSPIDRLPPPLPRKSFAINRPALPLPRLSMTSARRPSLLAATDTTTIFVTSPPPMLGAEDGGGGAGEGSGGEVAAAVGGGGGGGGAGRAAEARRASISRDSNWRALDER